MTIQKVKLQLLLSVLRFFMPAVLAVWSWVFLTDSLHNTSWYHDTTPSAQSLSLQDPLKKVPVGC